MAGEFRLPDTPPQGFVFPPPRPSVDIQQGGEVVELGDVRKKPNLRVTTHEVPASPPPQVQQQTLPPPPPPPPPPARTRDSSGRNKSIPKPIRTASGSSSIPAQPSARGQYESPGKQADATPTHQSRFPQYAPPPAAPQPYQPGFPTLRTASPGPMQADKQSSYSQSIYSVRRHSHMHQGSLSEAFAATQDPANCPLPSYRESMRDIPAVIQSTPDDVLDLWCLANGQETQELALAYNLAFDCTDLTIDNELLCLTSTAGAVYTMRASNNSLNLTRTHPFNGADTVSIAAPTLYAPTDTSPLVTTIFPTLSKIRAIDQANSVAISHALPRSESLGLEREAIKRAHANTAAPILWNAAAASYVLSLPIFSNASNDPSNPASAPVHQCLPIEINPTTSIRLLEPSSTAAAQSPLLTLSLPNKTLIVHAHALRSLPSPYAVDICLSALLSLTLHLHRQSSILTNPASVAPVRTGVLPTFAPPPTIGVDMGRGRSRAGSRTRDRSASRSRAGSRLEGLLHPGRNNGSDTASSRTQTHSRAGSRLSVHSAMTTTTTLHGSPPLLLPTTPGLEKGFGDMGSHAAGRGTEVGVDGTLSKGGTAPELDGKNTGLDLSRFQAYDLRDPRLGPSTRVMLRLLYWTFGVLVWVLGVGVGVLAELVVLLGGMCGRSRKQ